MNATEVSDVADADMIGTVAEALAGVTITDPEFEGLYPEDWRELAAAALKAVRAVDATAWPCATIRALGGE